MQSSNILGAVFALTSAIVWGGGDFSGGLASRKINQFQVLFLASLSGMILLFVGIILLGEGLPTWRTVFWGALAGATGALGVASLYRALSMGHTASIAPTSAIVTAILPVLFGTATAGLPRYSQLAGFAVAFLGLWLVTKSPSSGEKSFRQGMLLAFLAGIGFGGFFIFIAQVDRGQVFMPVLIARVVTLLVAFIMLSLKRIPIPALKTNPVAILAGLLDTGGNITYLLATQLTRLDVAAVLSSLYPAGTVVLATLVLKEKVSLSQWMGAALCVMAIGLITV